MPLRKKRSRAPSSKQNIREQLAVWYAVCYVVVIYTVRVWKSAVRFTRLLWRPFAHQCERLIKAIYTRWLKPIGDECRRIGEGFRIAGDKVHDSRSWRVWLSLPLIAFQRHRRMVLSVLNVLLPAVAAVVLVVTIGYWGRAEYGLSLNYRGIDIGCIANEDVFVNASSAIKSSVINADGSFAIDRMPNMKIEVLGDRRLLNEEETRDRLLTVLDASLMDGFGLYVDGKFYGAVSSKATLQEQLDAVLTKHDVGKYDAVDFLGEIEIVEGVYPSSSSVGITDLQTRLSSLPVKTIKNITYTETVKYTTVYLQDPSLPLGYESPVSSGVNGKQRVNGQIIYVNGKEMYRTVVSTEYIKAPKNRVVKIGAQTYSDSSVIGDGKATGRFIWPLPYTKVISSPFANRWGRLHGAIDISNGSVNGKPIIATDGGTVIEADFHGSYGYYVLIDHGNGFKTRYAHCSKLKVEVGQKVAQGQYIANVGNTGYSLGAHLHFEIIKDGALVDPLKYVER